MDLTDDQWAFLEPLITPMKSRPGKPGRPARDARAILDGVMWILRTGAQWKDLPPRYPPYQTCHRRFKRWSEDGTMPRILEALARDLLERGDLDLRETFIDGTFVPAKKGGVAWETPSGAKVRRSWQLQTALAFLSPYAQRVLRRMKWD
jgi:transposase